MTTSRSIEVRGAYDLRQSAEFGFGQRQAVTYDGSMTLAMCLDGYTDHGVVVLRPDGDGLVAEVVTGDPDVAVAQAARVLSVDVDATGYDELGRRDPLVGDLQRVRPGLRPPLFHSAYEAVAWSVISSRRPWRQAARVRDVLATEHGRVVRVGDADLPCFPTPEQLLGVSEVPGLPEVAVTRLHAIAEEARGGGLDTERLRALPPEDATARLRALPGIGPFYAELVVVRTLGHTDVAPTHESLMKDLAARLVGETSLTDEAFTALTAGWAPWRTWVSVAVRAAGPALLEERGAAG